MTPYEHFKRLMDRSIEHYRIAECTETGQWIFVEPFDFAEIPYRTILDGQESKGVYLRPAWQISAGATVILQTWNPYKSHICRILW